MKTKKALAAGLCGANCPGCIQKTHICWFEREKPVCHSFVSALERCAFLPVLPGRCCRCAYSQNPPLSRGLEEALEGLHAGTHLKMHRKIFHLHHSHCCPQVGKVAFTARHSENNF